MIKVLHIFARMNRGGSETRTVELMPLLAKMDISFDFCTMMAESGDLDEKIRQLGGEVIPCRLKPNLWDFDRNFLKLLKHSDYDIVHSHSHYFSGYIVRLAHKAGIKARIVHFRNTFDGKANTLQRRLYKNIMRRWIDKHATAILAVCRGAMEFGWGTGWEKDSRAQVIYNGLDLSPYQSKGNERKDVMSELGLPEDSKLIINVAHIHRQKAHDLLLDAAAKVVASDPAFHFLLIGDGVLRQAMEAKAKGLCIAEKVHFLGVRSDVPRLLKASDCFVLPSRWEGLPGAVLEAVAAELPVVATDLPGVREIAEHTNLINIISVNDKDALAEGVLNVFDSRRSQEKRTLPFPEEFSLQRCAEKLFDVYTSQIEV